MKLTIILLAVALCAPAGATTRSAAAKRAFVREHACPSTGMHRLPCRGYVIDHIRPIDCGGPDAPENLQWQSIADAREKDKWERNAPECRHRTKGDRQ